MTNNTHELLDHISAEQATALTWLVVCAGARECKCHIVDKCIRCVSMEKVAAAFPNLYATYEQARKEEQ
jgi:hypothetical protein